MCDNVVADSSFYICYCDDIKKHDFLSDILSLYSFHVGPIIKGELPEDLIDSNYFQSSVAVNDASFFELVKPYFGRIDSHKNDGEYEAIGLAYDLNTTSNLKCLIIDERRAYNFVNSNFPSLKSKLTRNIGFILNCCQTDKTVSVHLVIDILESIKECIIEAETNGNQKRPCSFDKKTCEEIIVKLIKQLKDKYVCS
ncbi:hypothetical protein MettiDRAFT_1932 [Methanolobus tindarius DSM 2278]|uniref:Uncharacterized protein n=1 Tax=Methanolobus tindarius DSM 2278 TaxID=1090322 RepID=W9DYJ5_METTI|nr:hypothetical protein [Methanolobus tindarius]ETA68461.1 hypothetical protein MettiDRAFT_1932 [Methanolobus tindarius DSM 2278]